MAEERPDSEYTAHGTFKVERPQAFPDLLDVFIAGGGPAGTAAAVRAKELGLSCFVVDYDDLLKRIRDYPKEKLIKPNYGGGDKLQFPVGGPMLASLAFEDVDKDDFVAAWKGRYKEYGIGARVGSEFTGLTRLGDDTWEVRTWNHRSGRETKYRARNVLIAIGAGVPRRFDIPGNTDGIAFRLDDPHDYIGAPVLVIGGGTSAAEAVIAISNAKIAAEDTTAVYWSYRGTSMPKVSKALSEVFFNAWFGNGNIHYIPYSEPTAVVTASDKQEYLSLRVDRKVCEGRPAETLHYEFPKDQVVACIGEDIPTKLLQGIGIKIPLVNDRPLMLVNHDGEVSLAGVFLVGDARGPKYLRCTDFNDSGTYEQVVEKRNIKASMVDAVKAIEVIAARAGYVGSKVGPTPAAPAAAPPATPAAPAPPVAPGSAVAVVPPAPAEPEGATPSELQLVSLHPDETPEEQFALTTERVTIGRRGSGITFPTDVYLADRHAVLIKRDGGYVLEDVSGGSGVWVRVKGVTGRALGEGDLVWVGSQLLMATKAEGHWALAHYDGEGIYQGTHPVGDRGLFAGRASDLRLDAGDLSLSRRHAQFRLEGGVLSVFDLGSRNGTYVKVTAPLPLANGTEFRVGSKRLRFEQFAAVSRLAPTDVVVEASREPVAAPSPPAAGPAPAAPVAPGAVPAGMLAVDLQHAEYAATFGVAPGQDLLHAYFESVKSRFPGCKVSKKGEPTEHMDEPLGWECKVGLCGLCAVQVVEGADNFVPIDPGSPELDTLKTKAGLDPDPKRYRLACLAKIKGPVKLTVPG